MNNIPQIIKQVGFDFNWDESKVWMLDIPVEKMPINELIWHFNIPFWSNPNGYYDLTPQEVITSPQKFSKEHQRILDADISYPLDVMMWKNRWLLLDGLHRLAKLYING